MSKASDDLYNQSRAAHEKFDYFICGVASALFGYLSQAYVPTRLDNFWAWLNPAGLCFLLLAFVAGLLRIQTRNYAMDTNFQILQKQEGLKLRIQGVNDGRGFLSESGNVIPKSQIQDECAAAEKHIAAARESFEKMGKKSGCYYNIRNVCLLIALVAIVLAKASSAYRSE